ncbi:hypothetical protein Ahy_A02g005427 [Arachis hypogaea]|uniref:SWIM-type domain-containing protein n=1 Tax=Arachis hypogaea TaxID=3818 RepID=A0A445E6Q1_ARAHY|nr:hypothetical protein Ahy_A02g005427 [Arachis hypogaea]
MEFKEAVREYCILEGRRIWFKKNDNVRMRAIKTFVDDHTCARETKNRLANKKWLACKLVKKLRKYPNLRYSETTQYFKTKCDLDLNKSSLTKALGDARSIVYGDAAAQYGMVRDYGLTLLKSNPGSTGLINAVKEKFKLHDWPTNMVVDLGKKLCTCGFWQLSGMPCVHACAALARAGKRPEEFCHEWLTMKAYNNTYAFYINPISGQAL